MPPRPPYLYKYQSITVNSLKNLKTNKLWFSNIDSFNDPFEFRFYFEKSINHNVRMLFTMFNNCNKDMGVSCLSEIYDDILMWGHYTDGHKGFCLKFDSNYFPFTEHPLQVRYADSIFKIDDVNGDKPGYVGETLLRIGCRKAKHWEYEREWRIIKGLGNRAWEYEPNALESIFFGAKMLEENRDMIVTMLKGTPTKIYLMELDDFKYKLNPKLII